MTDVPADPKPAPSAKRIAAAFRVVDLVASDTTRIGRQSLTTPIKCAIMVLLDEGELTRKGHFWYSAKGSRVAFQTIESMFARYLIKIVTESRHRRKQFARLTEVGEVLARGLKYQDVPAIAPDDYESATEAYGEERTDA